MRTNFSAQRLAEPEISELNDILRKCVHCGFCNATCPTFQVTGDELDGPRGRIYLLKALLEEDTSPSTKVVRHLDRCLSCLSCMTTCPSGVDYMHLVDHGRQHIEKVFHRPVIDRLFRQLLALTMTRPAIFRRLLKAAALLSPVSPFLPARLSGALRLSRSATPPEPAPLQDFYGATVEKRGAVALLPGCVQQVMAQHINHASIRVLNRLGFDVHVLVTTQCCGGLEHHLGQSGKTTKRLRNNLAKWDGLLGHVDAIISNASGCGNMLRDYGHLSRGHEYAAAGNSASALTRDICEFISVQGGLRFSATAENFTVAMQTPCSLQHGQKITREPFDLLEQAGFRVVDIPDSHLCCGSAGTYNILEEKMARELGLRKAKNIGSSHADVFASGNLGCLTQLEQYLDIPGVHYIELLDWASGGPKPTKLQPGQAS